MSEIEVPYMYRNNDGVTVRIYFIDLTEGIGSLKKLGTLLSHRRTSDFVIRDGTDE
jgi:hypothetical protein